MFGKQLRNTFNKITTATKTTATKIVSATKHKGLVTSIPDEHWNSRIVKIQNNYQEVTKLIVALESFVNSVKNSVEAMLQVSASLSVMCLPEDIPENTQKYQQYGQVCFDIKANALSQAVERLTVEIIPLMKQYEAELGFLLKICEERTPFKIERDHYYEKMQKLSSGNTAEDMMKRNSEKQSRTETQLQMIEAPLYLRINDFESRHDSIMSYVFNVYVSIQKRVYAALQNALVEYPEEVPVEQSPSLPLTMNYGIRTDIEEVKDQINRQNAQYKQMEAQRAQQAQFAQQPQLQPQYQQPQYQQPQYQQPQYQQPQYQQPQYQQPQYQQPQYQQPQYQQPQAKPQPVDSIPTPSVPVDSIPTPSVPVDTMPPTAPVDAMPIPPPYNPVYTVPPQDMPQDQPAQYYQQPPVYQPVETFLPEQGPQ